jgi:hypothetical protein
MPAGVPDSESPYAPPLLWLLFGRWQILLLSYIPRVYISCNRLIRNRLVRLGQRLSKKRRTIARQMKPSRKPLRKMVCINNTYCLARIGPPPELFSSFLAPPNHPPNQPFLAGCWASFKKGWFGGWFGGAKKEENNSGGGPIRAKLGEESSFSTKPALLGRLLGVLLSYSRSQISK